MLERYYQELVNFCARMTRNPEMATAVAQKSYAQVLANSPQEVSYPRATLYRTAKQFLQDSSHIAALGGSQPTSVAAPSCQPEQASDAVLSTIQALPRRRREAFILHRFDGLSHQEIAHRLGMSRRAVEQHIRQALLVCRQQGCGQNLRGARA